MSNAFLLLTPILVFFVVLLVGFVGCGGVLPAADDSSDQPPPDTTTKPPPTTKPKNPASPIGPGGPITNPVLPPGSAAYQNMVTSVPGFAAFWPLDEPGGSTVKYIGSLSPSADGEIRNAAGGPASFGSYSLGMQGVLFGKDNTDLAGQFAGTEAFIEIPFVAALNPVSTPMGFCIELWAKPNLSAGSDRGPLVSSHHFDSPNSQQGYEIGLLKVQGQAHQQVYARVYGGPAMTISEITTQPNDGGPEDWRHIVMRYGAVPGKGIQLLLRVQVLKSTQIFRAESTNPILYDNVTSAKPSTLRFGGSHLQQPGSAAVFGGLLDKIAFYNSIVNDETVFDDHYKMAL